MDIADLCVDAAPGSAIFTNNKDGTVSTVTKFNNPTRIERMQGNNYFRFCITPVPESRSGYFTADDLDNKSTLPTQLKLIGEELAIMDSVERFYINIGGDAPDRIVVKFKYDMEVDDGLLMVVADFIGERLG